MVTMEYEYELVCSLWNGDISNAPDDSNVVFQNLDIFQRQVTRKWYKAELYLYYGRGRLTGRVTVMVSRSTSSTE